VPKLVPPAWLHFKRFLAHPLQVQAVLPASKAWGALIAKQVRRERDEFVVELGAGTGAVTRALLTAGVPPQRLFAVEIDPEMAEYLRANFPEVNVIAGDALAVDQAVPGAVAGKTGTVVCGVAVATFSLDQQRRLVAAVRSLLSPNGRLVVFSYRPLPPLPASKLGLKRIGMAMTLLSLPPGFVWTYELAD
jgi:phosphatidylethanolamine/phosphatidyl-N-methylethanolamine N-methyltransferase